MKFLLTFISLALILSAHDMADNLKIRILEKIFSAISINQELRVWSDNKEVISHIKDHGRLITEQNCEDANMIILEDKEKLKEECSTKYIFVLNYQLLSDIPKSFGSFFWKKGRPNIVIIEPRIKDQSISIDKELRPYLEDKVW